MYTEHQTTFLLRFEFHYQTLSMSKAMSFEMNYLIIEAYLFK